VAPVLALGLLGLLSISFPQLLGNGKDIAQLAFSDQLPFAFFLVLLILKPAATMLCLATFRRKIQPGWPVGRIGLPMRM
jgi:H+/Cl- antiporter ClcA